MLTEHIYWFAYFSDEEPSVRYRAKYALQYLNTHHGISYDLVYPGYHPLTVYRFIKTFLSIIFSRKANSVIVFEKIHTNWLYATALKLLLKVAPERTLYDIDDADYLKFKPGNIVHFMKNVEKCAAGSRSIANFITPINGNVFTLTSPVIDHSFIKSQRNDVFTIGWIGYYNAHRDSLQELFFPALQQISFPVKLVLMGVVKQTHIAELRNQFRGHKYVDLHMPLSVDWRDEASVYEAIAGFDVGIAPLLDTEINRAKSAFKLKQCMSCGVPVLASGTGENKAFLKDGINGYVCDSPSDFAAGITRLMEMTDGQYSSMSMNALSTVNEFSMLLYCNTLIHNLNNNTNGTVPYGIQHKTEKTLQ